MLKHWWETCFLYLLSPMFCLAVVGFVARGLFTQWLKHDLEGYKAELSRTSFEHEIRYSRMHERRAVAIERLYGKLTAVEGCFKDVVERPVNHFIRHGKVEDELTDDEKLKRLSDCLCDFESYFWQKRIFLDEPLCKSIEALLAQIHVGQLSYNFSRQVAQGDKPEFIERARQAEKAVPGIRAEIEKEFRATLGVGDAAPTGRSG